MQNFVQYQFATDVGFQMVLAPIRGSLLSVDAAQIDAANKVAMTEQSADRITHVNGVPVYNVRVDAANGEIWFDYQATGAKVRHIHTIQHAQITIAAAVLM